MIANTDMDNTQVDFYILQDQSQRSILTFCCRLTEKAWKLGNSVHIRTNDENETQHLDDLMWTYTNESFLPHATQDENLDDKHGTPIIVGHNISNTSCDLLINLAFSSPDQIKQYPRIAEILNENETIKQHGRERYTKYKQSGCAVQHHQIGSK